MDHKKSQRVPIWMRQVANGFMQLFGSVAFICSTNRGFDKLAQRSRWDNWLLQLPKKLLNAAGDHVDVQHLLLEVKSQIT